MQKWLVTGGCGFIGTSLVQWLVSNHPGVSIRILDNLSQGCLADLESVVPVCLKNSGTLSSWDLSAKAAELLVGDIRDLQTCLEAADGADVIVHLAASTGVGISVENPRLDMENNVIGVFNMLEAARHNKTKSFIFASSGAPAGIVEPPVHENCAPRPVSPYGASKLAGEGYCSAYFHSFGIKTVALRFGNVYGPRSGHKQSVVARFIRRALAGKPLTIYGDGCQTRDFIYIDDLLEAIWLACEKNVGGEVFQIATSRESSVSELVHALKNELEKQAPGLSFSVVHESPRKGDVLRNFADTSKAGRILGWQSKWPLEKGLAQTVGWFLKS